MFGLVVSLVADQKPHESTSATIAPDGGFSLPGVVPGRYRWRGTFGSVVVNGVDVSDLSVEIKAGENISGALLTIAGGKTTLTGDVQEASGRPAIGSTVVVFASDPQYWLPQSRRVQARTTSDGHFMFDVCHRANTFSQPSPTQRMASGMTLCTCDRSPCGRAGETG